MTSTTATGPVVLSLEGLVKGYGDKNVLNNMSLHVRAGEIVGLLGPNGVGKSTTLRVAAGVALAEQGVVTVAGVDMGAEPLRARSHIGFLPDVGGLHPRLSVIEHLELVARLRAIDNWEARAHEMLRRVELLDSRSLPAGRCSHGMARRLGVAIALMASPPVVLLDEPFDGVDPLASVQLRTLLRNTADEGAGIICSTHLLEMAAKTCDRLAVVADGAVVCAGTEQHLLDTASERNGFRVADLEAAYAVFAGRTSSAAAS